MRTFFRHGRLWAWLILLVAGLAPVHAFADEALDACATALSEAHDHHHDHHPGQDRDFSESDPCHEHCAIGPTAWPSRTYSVAIAPIADLPPTPALWLFLADPYAQAARSVRPTWPATTSSAYHQRVGLRLYA